MTQEVFNKMTPEEYRIKTVGEKYPLPMGLEKLFLFAKNHEHWYAESFQLTIQEEDYSYMLDVDSDIKILEYKKYIKKFAQVDFTGGFCAFWIENDEINDLENSPIINYGSEGSIRIVASNIYEFLRLLTFDTELMDGVCYKMKTDYQESNYKNAYVSWLKSELNLEPVKDLESHQEHGESEDVIKFREIAEERYKKKFIEWHQQYVDIAECFEI